MHQAVTNIATSEGFHNKAEKLSDYYQIEVTYSRTMDDIVLMINVPFIKHSRLLKIFGYLPFPIPIPFKTNAHNMTIKQPLFFQEPMMSRANYEDLFDQNDLDYEQPSEALFITDTADLIAIDNNNNFQVVTQTDLAN